MNESGPADAPQKDGAEGGPTKLLSCCLAAAAPQLTLLNSEVHVAPWMATAALGMESRSTAGSTLPTAMFRRSQWSH